MHRRSSARSAGGHRVSLQSINPATGTVLERFEETAPPQVDRILARADTEWRDWSRRPVAQRVAPLSAAARLLRDRKERYARFMALEMGKPLEQGVAEGAERVHVDPRVRAVNLTGSDRAGSVVGEQAAHHLKKTVLELGGSDPFIVLEDAVVSRAATVAAEARLQNSGQSCIAAKRFIVVERVADEFLELFTEAMRAYRVGDPLDAGTQIGPQARRDLRDNHQRQVESSVQRGARIVLGGRVPDGPGAFYPPTVLDAVQPGSPAFDEETFGPVAAVIRVLDEVEAIRIVNASAYGLGASVWTADPARGERIARDIDVRSVFVNGIVKSDPSLPFGGVKRSDYRRELSE